MSGEPGIVGRFLLEFIVFSLPMIPAYFLYEYVVYNGYIVVTSMWSQLALALGAIFVSEMMSGIWGILYAASSYLSEP